MATTLTLTATNGAMADGNDKNIITAVVMDGGEYKGSEPVIFEISGIPAIFDNDSSIYELATNALGVCTLTLTSRQPGSATVTAFLNSTPSVTASTTSDFYGSESWLTISLTSVIDNSSANGTSGNKVSVKVDGLNEGGNPPSLKFFVTGNGYFEGNLNSTVVQVDTYGEATVSVFDKTPEKISLLVYVENYTAVPQSIDMTFSTPSSDVDFSVSTVVETNNIVADGKSINSIIVNTTDSSGLNNVANVPLYAVLEDFNMGSYFENKSKLLSFETNESGRYEIYVSSETSSPLVINIYDASMVLKGSGHLNFSNSDAPVGFILAHDRSMALANVHYMAGKSYHIDLLTTFQGRVSLALHGEPEFKLTSSQFMDIQVKPGFNDIEIYVPASASKGCFIIQAFYMKDVYTDMGFIY